jgi:DNA-binding transcriptional MerR regulator
MQTLKEIAEAVSIPESTLRLYRDEFEEYLPAMGEGRRRRYADSTATLLRQVVEWKKKGWSATQIRDGLAKVQRPQDKARRRTTDERLDEIAARLITQQSEVAALRIEVGALREEIRNLTDALRQPALTMEEALLGRQ